MRLRRSWPQWVTALLVTLLCISVGLCMGWTSPYLALLTGDDAPFPVSQEQGSWIAALLPLGRLFGAIVGALLVEYLGNKSALFITGLPLIIGWVCIMAADSIPWLYVFRLFGGLSMGMLFTCYPLFIGEISEPAIRGALIGLIVNGIPVGTLLGNIMGAHLIMFSYGIISLTLTLVYIGCFPFLPPSPYHYIKHDDMERAEKSMWWYQRKSDVTDELRAMERFVYTTRAQTMKDRFQHMGEPGNRRAFMIVLVLFVFMHLSGMNVVIFYMEIIVREGMVTSIEPWIVVIIVTGAGIIFGWLGAYTIDTFGRKVLQIVSTAGVLVGMVLLGLHFLLLDCDYDPANLEWLIILSLLLFILLCFGIIPVSSTMLSELFTSDLKSIAGFLSSTISAICAFISTKTYQPLVIAIGHQYVFWIYALITLGNLVFSIICVPETKGKTLEEIQEILEPGAGRRRTIRMSQIEEIRLSQLAN